MKISDDVVSGRDIPDYNKIYLQLCEKYRNVFTYMTQDNVFIYRALGRQEYRDIVLNKNLNEFEKEEIVCEQCLLYPKDFDFNKCEAGLPTALEKDILEHSYLDNLSHRADLHQYYRDEMYNLDNQITCIINEAFPQYDIEQIEQWDIEKTTKYLSRAEWKLQNFHSMQLVAGLDEIYGVDKQRDNNTKVETPAEKKVQTEGYSEDVVDKYEAETIRGGNKKEKLTPDKIRSRDEFYKKFPEFAHLHDNGMDGDAGLEQATIDKTSPALRVGSDEEDVDIVGLDKKLREFRNKHKSEYNN